ncbi:L-seryl-tRNA(Sec) selenium transferase [Aliihoeflea aestuarii]|jgi:L-seryl-tRNA(Ser) seleniumtransferase|uniref:L-seryl-tRNA(Sec) selenium transferase n=1 Tax=Aliihoeflea aestuarii TaxID=453840 RepID=UPI002092C873|nr:L-seryl-tRNA(Sec) selenium transferase [Aliihoeflea aestuarii]MCO6390531.1 L-seryl-tRNA(Sec) selenium transferase [Aliihoeflea aestuarii]
MNAGFRAIPSVDAVLRSCSGQTATARFGHAQTTGRIRALINVERETARSAGMLRDAEGLGALALAALEAQSGHALRPVFNLTGTVLHTNLGRAVLADTAIDAAMDAMRDAVALEFDLDTGKRGERDDHLRALICELTGAEDATIVNNNAAAVLLVLNTLAGDGGGAVVSRGELIEIGGAFRMPDIMRQAGARLIEVGTTNRTHEKDYKAALDDEAVALILKVHTSNYRIEGFTKEVGGQVLSVLARNSDVPLVNDLGSGTLVDLARWGLRREPTVREAVAEGADLVTFSGDKLLGGPQAGFIVGRKDLIERINRNPMKRALRVDKMRLAALEATLKLYRDPDRLAERLPTLRLLARQRDEISDMAIALLPHVEAALGEAWHVAIVDCESQIGSGALPLDTLPSAGFAIRAASGSGQALERLAAALRGLAKPVIGRIAEGAIVLDLRCLEDGESFVRNLQGAHIGLA